MRRLVRASAAAATAAILAACSGSGGGQRTIVGSPITAAPVVYVAVGASETEGVGTEEPLLQAWPRVLWQEALSGALYYGLGVSGSSTAQALAEQVPEAVAAAPDVATVWLNVNDLIQGVPTATYETELRDLVHRLRRGGATQVLVATTPRLDTLPAYLACRPASTSPQACLVPAGIPVPSPGAVRTAVAAYNRAIRSVVQEEGAILVDLTVLGDASDHPEYVSEDGFHPSAAGAVAVAAAFAAAIPVDLVRRAGGTPAPPP